MCNELFIRSNLTSSNSPVNEKLTKIDKFLLVSKEQKKVIEADNMTNNKKRKARIMKTFQPYQARQMVLYNTFINKVMIN